MKLADRIEQADGPSRVLDEEIMALLYVRDERHIGAREGWRDEPFEQCTPVKSNVWIDPKTDKWVSTHAHHFTTSIDDAMTLVPACREWHAGKQFKGGGSAYILCSKVLRDPIYVSASTPALALCAAALRAQEAGE